MAVTAFNWSAVFLLCIVSGKENVDDAPPLAIPVLGESVRRGVLIGRGHAYCPGVASRESCDAIQKVRRACSHFSIWAGHNAPGRPIPVLDVSGSGIYNGPIERDQKKRLEKIQ